jgi:hypothetical protein
MQPQESYFDLPTSTGIVNTHNRCTEGRRFENTVRGRRHSEVQPTVAVRMENGAATENAQAQRQPPAASQSNRVVRRSWKRPGLLGCVSYGSGSPRPPLSSSAVPARSGLTPGMLLRLPRPVPVNSHLY